jgi:hypothetical protein
LPRDGIGERALLDAKMGRLKLGTVAQRGIQDPAQAVGHGDDRHLVASAHTQLHEVRDFRAEARDTVSFEIHEEERGSAHERRDPGIRR